MRLVWTGLIHLRIGMGDGGCKHGNEPAGSVKYRKFSD